MLLSKKNFVEVINRIDNLHNLKDDINEKFKTYVDNTENDFCNTRSICISLENLETALVYTLKVMFDDTDTDLRNKSLSKIDRWIYELDCGRKYEKGCITELDGTPIDASTPEKLYDALYNSLMEKLQRE